jgi:hypothetical protein
VEVTREIQTGYYGRQLDPSRPNDPSDEQGCAYPVYVVFCLAPTIGLPFTIVQKIFLWVLIALTVASTQLWLRVLRWSIPAWAQIPLVALTLGSLAVMHGLKLQQMSLLVAGLVAIAVTLLVTDHGVAAGILLGLSTMKPQFVFLLLPWLAIWTAVDWRRRYRWSVSFLATMAILIAASEWYLPHWIPLFLHTVREYRRYTGALSVLDSLIGAPWSRAVELLVLAVTAMVCWRERRQAVDSAAFALTLSLVLAVTILVVPSCSPNYQILLLPALLALIKERQPIWQRNIANRILFATTTCLIVWPWISSVTLAALSFVLSQQTVERGWTMPFWTVTEIPVAVAALMLVHCYQRSFTAPSEPGSS